jgi:hypothetical protein
MTADQLFLVVNSIALVGWIPLIIAPYWRWTHRFIRSGLVPLLLGGLYLYVLIRYFGQSPGGFSTLDEVVALFGTKEAILAGWIHYLAFDLMVGVWMVGNAEKHQIHHLWLIPALLLCFMVGPAGLVLYLLLRTILTRKFLTLSGN